MGDVVLRPWHDGDLDWWVAVSRDWWPVWSEADLRSRAASGRYLRRTLAVAPGGRRVGSCVVIRPPGEATYLGVTVMVDASERGRGPGRLLWTDVEPWLDGVELLSGLPGGDDVSLAVARHWGFDVASVGITSELDVSQGVVPPREVPGVEAVVRVGAELVERGPDVTDLLYACQTNPEAVELGWRFTRDDLIAMTPSPLWVVLLDHGTPVALALADTSPGDHWDVFFTGVAPASRGRGLGRLVKEHLHAAGLARGARVMATENEERNQEIRALNASMGYVVVGSSIRLRRAGAAYDGRALG